MDSRKVIAVPLAFALAGPYLGVNFQEVVHSVLTGNADVAKPQ